MLTRDQSDDRGESAGLTFMTLQASPKPDVQTQDQVDDTLCSTLSSFKVQDQTRVTALEGK